MTDEPKAVFIIGGPLQGRTANVLHGSEFVAPVYERDPFGNRVSGEHGAKVAQVHYRKFVHHVNTRAFAVWVPADWTDEQAAEKVFGIIADLWESELMRLCRPSR